MHNKMTHDITEATENAVALLRAAAKVRDKAYCPYSHHPVGVAIRTSNGEVYEGVNVEAAHFKGICAEASALSAMILTGQREISEIAVVGPENRPCWPCGDCRQRLLEFSIGSTLVHTYLDDTGNFCTRKLSELLPESFGPGNLSN